MKQIFFLVLCVVLFSCRKDGQSTYQRSLVTFYAQKDVTTRVDGLEFQAGDKIGVFATKTHAGQSSNFLSNRCFEKTAAGFSSESCYYEKDNYSYDFAAYYPFNQALAIGENSFNYKIELDQTINVDYINSDLLYAHTSNINNDGNIVPLNFKHAFSRLEIQFNLQQPVVDSITALIENSVVDAQVNFKDNLISLGSIVESVTPSHLEKMSDVKYGCRAIIIPQTIAANEKFVSFFIGKSKYSYVLTDAISLEPGVNYLLEMSVKNGASTKARADVSYLRITKQ